MSGFDEKWLERNRHRVLSDSHAGLNGGAAEGARAIAPVPTRANLFEHRSEAEIQMAVVRWARGVEPIMPAMRNLAHIPNGEKRDGATFLKIWKMGGASGLPDLMLFHRSGDFCGLGLELKYGENDLSELQIEWLLRLQDQGWAVDVAWTFEQAKFSIINYLLEPESFVGGI